MQSSALGFDVHQAMTVVAVLDADGKVVLETMVPTEAAAIIRLVQSLSGPLRVTFEETTQAAWLHEVIRAYPERGGYRRSRLRHGCAGDHPIIREPCESISPASHLLIKRRQKNVTEQR